MSKRVLGPHWSCSKLEEYLERGCCEIRKILKFDCEDKSEAREGNSGSVVRCVSPNYKSIEQIPPAVPMHFQPLDEISGVYSDNWHQYTGSAGPPMGSTE